jgi:signal transduction histidine kinase
MYFREVRRPSASDVRLVTEAAGAAALAVQHVRVRESLAKAVQVRDEFLSAASHELRTPLTPLKMQAQVLARLVAGRDGRWVKPDELTWLVEGACKKVSKLLKVTEDLLNVARVGAGELTLKRSRCDLAAIAREASARYREEAEKAHCLLHVHADSPVIGEWDREQIERVVINLLTNAMKFGAGKPIEIWVTSQESGACLQVKDVGIGIAEDDQRKLFRRFERIAPLMQFGGLGLGLYISREIVNAHGGTIEVKSAPNQGACFVVNLPAH